MVYYLIIGICCFVFTIGLRYVRDPFLNLARFTTQLLNTLLDTQLSDDDKQKLQIKYVVKVLAHLTRLLLTLGAILLVSILPLIVFVYLGPKTWDALDLSSFKFIGSMVLGSLIVLMLPGKKEPKDYSEWSMLLHFIALENYNISKVLFNLEKKLFLKKRSKNDRRFIIVSGLARSGTTALTSILYESPRFHALTYANMPFLLSVRLWRTLYKPTRQKLKERKHGDQTLFGYKTIEALEEYFFKVFLRDSYIGDSLSEHEIGESCYDDYLSYQDLVSKGDESTIYLAKNNNFILRYRSIRKLNKAFLLVLLFRTPLDHARSLLRQQLRFTQFQKDEPFILDYMNWLGHHEFGLNHKPFQFGETQGDTGYAIDTLNYWLVVWINYYSTVLTLEDDLNLILVDYLDLLNDPNGLFTCLEECLDVKLQNEIQKFSKKRVTPDESESVDPKLLDRAEAIYRQLLNKKVFTTSTHDS